VTLKVLKHCCQREILIIGGHIGGDPFSRKTLVFDFEDKSSYILESELKTGLYKIIKKLLNMLCATT
jgi:hypothetical protein